MEEANKGPGVKPEDRRAYWQRHISMAQASPLTVSQYCREHQISKASFYYWRRSLQGQKPTTRSRTKNFVRVDVSPEPVQGIRLALGHGIFLHFDREPSVDWMTALVRSLGEASR